MMRSDWCRRWRTRSARADLAAIKQGFTEDAVARFADFPEMRGREAIMRFLRARFARTKAID